jgi:hypothetical protein
MYVLQYWFYPTSRWWIHSLPNLRWSFTIAICILTGFIIRLDKFKQNRLFDAPQTKWLVINLVMILLISNWAMWPSMHSRFRESHVKLLLFMAIAYKSIDTAAKFEGLMWAHMAGAYYVGYETRRRGRDMFGRVEKTGPADAGGDGNKAAASMVTSLPIFAFFFVRSYLQKRKLWEKLILFVFFGYVMDGIVMINSRGSFLAILFSSAYFFWKAFFDRQTTFGQKIKLVGVVFVALLAFAALADDAFWDRMGTISEEKKAEGGGGGRKVFWQAAVEMVKDYPYGVGGWGFQILSSRYVPSEFMEGAERKAVHSLYFQTLVERGYFGFLVLVGLILANFRFIGKTKKYVAAKGDKESYFLGIALESSFVAFLVAAVFLNKLNSEIFYWMPLFGAMYGNIYMVQDKMRPAEEAPKFGVPARAEFSSQST